MSTFTVTIPASLETTDEATVVPATMDTSSIASNLEVDSSGNPFTIPDFSTTATMYEATTSGSADNTLIFGTASSLVPTRTVPFMDLESMTTTISIAVSTYYDADSTTTITTTPALGSDSGSVLTSTVPGTKRMGTSPPTLITSAEASSDFTLTTASTAGISVAITVSVLVFVVGPLSWLWRKRWRYRWRPCRRRRTKVDRGPRGNALAAGGARRDALSDSETEIGAGGRSLGEHKMGTEAEDEIHRGQWECKRPPWESRDGIAELEGDACTPCDQCVGNQSSGAGELDGTETGKQEWCQSSGDDERR